MAYSTQSDLLNLISNDDLAELTTESGITPDPNVVAETIARGDSEIDSYLMVRYVLPFAATPARVNALSCAFALYYLYSRRPKVGMPPVIQANYQAGVAFLKQVVAGFAKIPDATGAELTGATSQVTDVESQHRVFDRHKLRGW